MKLYSLKGKSYFMIYTFLTVFQWSHSSNFSILVPFQYLIVLQIQVNTFILSNPIPLQDEIATHILTNLNKSIISKTLQTHKHTQVELHIHKPATLRKVALLHGCFLRFLNCTNGTKSCKASPPNKTLLVFKARYNKLFYFLIQFLP